MHTGLPMRIYTGIVFSLVLLSPLAVALDFSVKDEHFRQCLQQIADRNHWQSVTDVTVIECHNQNIDTIDGVEQFTHLQSLSLYNNNIREIAQLPVQKLTLLNIAKNKLPQLKLHDLPALETLYAFGNLLQNLDLSNLPKLKSLKANNNRIEKFTYDNLPVLEKLYLFDNKMITIDIYHLPQMNYMDVRQNPMPDKLYEDMDKLKGVTFLHNGNSRDWK